MPKPKTNSAKKPTTKGKAKKKAQKEVAQFAHYIKPENSLIQEALVQYRGNVLVTAKNLGVSRRSLYNWLEEFPELQEARKDGREYLKDVAEYKQAGIIENIKEKKPTKEQVTVLTSYLQTQAKDRGHVMKMENENNNLHKFEPITITYIAPDGPQTQEELEQDPLYEYDEYDDTSPDDSEDADGED